MRLFLKQKSAIDYLEFGICFPVFDFSTKVRFIEDKIKTRKISFETCVHYRSESFLGILLLGF